MGARFLKRLRYQQVASNGDDGFDEVISSSSPLGLPLISSQKAIQRKSTLYTLSHLSLSCLCLIASMSFFLSKYYHELSDEKYVRRLSAPSLSLPFEVMLLTIDNNINRSSAGSRRAEMGDFK